MNKEKTMYDVVRDAVQKNKTREEIDRLVQKQFPQLKPESIRAAFYKAKAQINGISPKPRKRKKLLTEMISIPLSSGKIRIIEFDSIEDARKWVA